MEHKSIEIIGEQTPEVQEILTPKVLELLQQLHRTFNPQQLELLKRRKQRQQEIEERGDLSYDPEKLKVATDLFYKMSTNQQFDQFLTLPAYEHL